MKQQGFTLIEVMVVVVILGVLAALVVPKIMNNPDIAREAKVRQDIRAIEAALNLYKLDNYIYPSTDQGLDALITKPQGSPDAPNWKQGGYLYRSPKDPWGFTYNYLSPGLHSEMDIWSYGADGQPEGDGVNKDWGNWNLQ
ncbi:type II secretion system major pseudopilin GspG [Candidatus Albibeggiatoa sp. nov. BB20]|uniref:type II secretion system major pseudopilin GspG n=1 Tax=Candidatus Albibeggiatoa sp. nov. BB20 TaxID=3162723 RepID=UPI003365AA5B